MTPATPPRLVPASRALRRARRIDRAAAVVIAFGGLSVIASVAGILVFIAAQATALFRDARVASVGTLQVSGPVDAAQSTRHALGVDDQGDHVYRAGTDARVRIWATGDGRPMQETPIPGLETAVVTVSSRSAAGDLLAVGTADGRAAAVRLTFPHTSAAPSQDRVEISLDPSELVEIDESRRPVLDVSAREGEGQVTVAGLTSDRTVSVWWRDAAGREQVARLRDATGERFTTVRVGRVSEVAAGTESGRVFVWSLTAGGARLTSAFAVGGRPVTALGWTLGDHTLIVGDAGGRLTGWFDARTPDEAGEPAKVEGHRFEPHASAVAAIVASGRDRSFLASAEDGSLVLHHATSRRWTVIRPPQAGGARAAAFVPRSHAVLVDGGDGQIARLEVDNPHPEATARALFGKVPYEGYPSPAFVWQSTGASDEFEPKLSVVPLAFGSLKAALYAMLFAVPLAVLGALYTSQFVHPDVRARLKPTVEFMAALPSVVVGLIAGLWLAAFVERHLLAVLLGMPLALASGTAGLAVWNSVLPPSLRGQARAGSELLVILPMILLGLAVAFAAGPWVERLWFDGDLRLWLNELGFTYDQRNGLVVGLAMGFAVIPAIYTIADDAFASVPLSLTAASAALGASRWQTAWRVVVPTASAGVIAAVMVGFGRAVGETMIVLMVSGNTPLMDWSIFNGLRTMSANIAIEAPEAPAGGTLYRVLFLSAALLFALTFAANTIAELLRQRLRDRYKAI